MSIIKSAFLLFDALTDKWVSNFFIVKPNDYSAKLAINTDNLPTKTTTVLTLPSGDLNLNNVFSTDQTNPQTMTGIYKFPEVRVSSNLQVGCHYQADTIGSRAVSSK